MVLSIDIGGTKIKYGLVDENGVVSKQDSIPTPLDNYKNLIEKLGFLYLKFSNADGIAISSPGTIEPSGKSTGISALPWLVGNNIKEDLEKKHKIKVSIENDANCVLLAENWHMKINSAAAIVIGTGIGGSFMNDGKILKGFDSAGTEFGMIISEEDGEIKQLAYSTINMVNEFNEKNNMNLDGRKIFEMYREGKKEVQKIVNKFYRKLVVTSLTIDYLFNPEYMIFSGGVTNELDFYENLMKTKDKMIKENKILDIIKANSKYKISDYKSDAQLAGAAYLWYNKEKENEKN